MPENGLKVCPGTQTLDSCTLGSDEKIRRPSSSFLPARVTLTNSDLARRSLQPKSRDRLNTFNGDGFYKGGSHSFKERRHSVGGGSDDTPGRLRRSRSTLTGWSSGTIIQESPTNRMLSGDSPNPLLPPKDSCLQIRNLRSKSKDGFGEIPVIYIRGGCKGYGRGPNKKNILNNLNMTVNKGEIYGLLGASGCGKTTLLSIIVGRRHLDSGSLRVFGGIPGDTISGIPGPRVGYMPQELALYEEFTVLETALYFGRIYGMSVKQIKLQLEFLMSLLDLPHDKRNLSSFSGGQQRRVSFLISLLADPELLILDEPTVGVDPLLRQNIWNHLLHLASQRRKTILITTHYIDETKQASKVGMLSGGRLLAEDSPGSLLRSYQLDNLEDVFLRLCQRERDSQESLNETKPSLNQTQPSFNQTQPFTPSFASTQKLKNDIFATSKVVSRLAPGLTDPNGLDISDVKSDLEYFDSEMKEKRMKDQSCFPACPSFCNFVALLKKNFLKLRRNPAMLIFIFLLPAIQVVFFCVAIGQEPANLRLGVVNEESFNCSDVSTGCSLSELSCRYLQVLETRVQITRFDNSSLSEDAAENGDIWGVIQFKANFSSAYVARISSPIDVDKQTLTDSSLDIRLDMSNQQVALTLQNMILQSFDNFTKSVLRDCSYPEEAASLPIHWGEPYYGGKNPSFTEFMAPGIIILIIYFLAVALTGEAFISERSSGILDRSWIAGVKPSEIIASHIVCQFLVMLVQTAVTLATIILGFNIPCRGPFGWLAVITVLQGLAGMSFGFLISALCDSQAVAMQLSIGSFYPNLLLSGILWPLEGMPDVLRQISLFLPNTYPCQAMRDIMLRGWDIEREAVYMGVVVSLVWIFIFLSLSWVAVRVRL
uniref:ABCH1 n=1 Tax=Eurytemora affinis TaxID=88015 RepID=A0A8B0MCV5_EURAF|nr:ABCH1 [Eurytemora affinis]